MSEWWTYRPSDFLMFSPRTYWRLFASINEAFWPAQPALIALGLAWLARARAQHLAAGALAITSAVVAWAFLWQRFTPINWPAQYFALAFALQAVVLSALTVGGRLHASESVWRRRAGIALIAWALLGHPLLAPAFGRPWPQAEVFGLAPTRPRSRRSAGCSSSRPVAPHASACASPDCWRRYGSRPPPRCWR